MVKFLRSLAWKVRRPKCSMFNVRPRQFTYACGIPLGQRGEPPQRNCLAMFNVIGQAVGS